MKTCSECGQPLMTDGHCYSREHDDETALPVCYPSSFSAGELVQHTKTKAVYRIIQAPRDDYRLEYCNEPFYVYAVPTLIGTLWHRRKSEMEDGRFKEYLPDE